MTGRPNHTVQLGVEALKFYARGLPATGVASQLGISEYAVKNRMKRLFRQIGARSSAHAIVICAIDGLLTREDLRAAYEDRRTAGEGEE